MGDSLEKARDSEQKYYRFSIMKSGSVSISFFNPLQRDSGQYWRVFLYNSEYEELFYMPVYGNKTNTVALKCGVPEGIYYIKIESSVSWGDASSTDVYTFEADFESSNMWEKDYYKFQLEQSGSLSLKFSNPLQGDLEHYWSVYLYNSQYQELSSMQVYGKHESCSNRSGK